MQGLHARLAEEVQLREKAKQEAEDCKKEVQELQEIVVELKHQNYEVGFRVSLM